MAEREVANNKEATAAQSQAAFRESVLSQQIDWQSYQGIYLTQRDVGLMLDYDKKPAEEQADLLEERGAVYAALFLKMLGQIRDKATVQYLLTLVAQTLEGHPERAVHYHAAMGRGPAAEAKGEGVDGPFAPLLAILRRDGEHGYTVRCASQIVATLLSHDVPAAAEGEVEDFMRWLLKGGAGQRTQAQHLQMVLMALKQMLKRQQSHALFVKLGGFRVLEQVFKLGHGNTQLLYLAGFVFWLLSFNAEMKGVLQEHRVIERIYSIVSAVLREKVVRICFAALVNMLPQRELAEEMVGAGIFKLLPSLLLRKWKDEDLVKDLRVAFDRLTETVDEMTSFERYKAAVLSGALRWTPVHDEAFFRTHSMDLEEGGFHLIGELVKLLSAKDPVTVQVAAFDLGEFGRFHPNGKVVIQKFKGKQMLMTHMSHDDPGIRKQALLAVQKLLVSNWASLAPASTGAAADKKR